MPRSTDLAVIVAPETMAPVPSVTVPVMVAVTSWARVAFALPSSATTTNNNPNPTQYTFFITNPPIPGRQLARDLLPPKTFPRPQHAPLHRYMAEWCVAI